MCPPETAEGAYRIRQGGKIKGASHDKPVLQVIYRTGDGRQESLTTTAEHPFWIRDEGWAAAGNLCPGDRLELQDRSDAEVVDLIDTSASVDVFNFEIDGFHTYYVGEAGVWVHNTSCAKAVVVSAARGVPQGLSLIAQGGVLGHQRRSRLSSRIATRYL